MPSSLLISAARMCASTQLSSFLKQSFSSFKAAGVSLKSHLALARRTFASVKAEFYFVTFSRSLIAFIRCFGAPAEVIFGFEPQWIRYSCAICIKKSALNLIWNSKLFADYLAYCICKLRAASKHEIAPDLLPLTRHSIMASRKQCSAILAPPSRLSLTNSSCWRASSNISCLILQKIMPYRGRLKLVSS